MARKKKQAKDLSDQAWRATQKFRALLPMLTGFARSLSGDPRINVKIIENGCYSTADTIFMSPPVGLAKDMAHRRSVCDKRDENLQLLCHACKQHEEILYKLFHEMGHQVHGTHATLGHVQCFTLADYAQEVWKPDFPLFAGTLANKVSKNIAKDQRIACVMGVSNSIHKWLGMVTNIIEDVRVDSMTFRARPGIELMAESLAYEVMAKGIESFNEDGDIDITHWRDRDIGMQVLVGIMNRAFGYDLDEHLHEDAIAAMEDRAIIKFTARVAACENEIDSFKLACQILHRLHQMELLDPPPEDGSEEEKEEEQNEDGEKSEKDGGEGAGGEDGDTASDELIKELKELLNCAIGAGPAGILGEDGEASAEEMAKAIAIAVIQSEYFEAPSSKITGVRINEFKKRDSAPGGGYSPWRRGSYLNRPDEWMPEYGIIAKALMKARIVFSANQRSAMVGNLKSGKIKNKKLYRAGMGDPRLFQQKLRPEKRSYHIVVMADVSGSNSNGNRMQLLKQMLLSQGELLHSLGVPFEMYAHSALPADDKGMEWSERHLKLDIYPIKTADEKWGAESRIRVANLQPGASNLDGHAMEFARKKCDAARATQKVILYSSDGVMPCENYAEELEVLERELALCKKNRYVTAGVGIHSDSPTEHGLPTVLVREPADISLVVDQLEGYLT